MYDLNHIYKVGNLILKLREEKGLSQSELGFKLGVTNKAVSRWENGRGYPDIFEDLFQFRFLGGILCRQLLTLQIACYG